VDFLSEGTVYPSRTHEFTPVFGGVSITHSFSFFCCPIMCLYVQCCDVRLDSHIKTMFGVSLPSVVCRMAHVVFTLFVLRIVMSNTYCVVLLFFVVLCTLCSKFLWIIYF